mgnify:CR=1 FL=1|tara:strand:- start:245169 stop:246452 length:1284 start_codon:yes stop_codon:yes gene_type:complete
MKRVLIITYYWPPAGGPGVQRWLNFVKYFRDFDIEPIVYRPENPHYPLVDDSFVNEIPSDIEILKLPVKEPYKLASVLSKKKTKQISSGIISEKKTTFLEKLMLFVRGNFFIPDARIGWVKPSVAYLSNYINENKVDAIVTTGPPHSLHLIGFALQEEFKTPWISDFRDPWTTIHYHKSLRLMKASAKKHKQLEAKVLNAADQIVVTSKTTKREFQKITDKPIEVITNGYENSELTEITPDPTFSIAHIGSLLSERNPISLWRVLSKLSSEMTNFKNDLKIKLAGTISSEILKSLEEHGLSENTDNLGYVSHSEAIKLQHSSQILLLVEIDRPETRSIIPGKLFEYLATKRPILAIGPVGSDMEDIIVETKSGNFFTPGDEVQMERTVRKLYERFKTQGLQVNSIGIEKYSRRELTRSMAGLILSNT